MPIFYTDSGSFSNNINITGSANISGSIILNQVFNSTNAWTGSLIGTSSYALNGVSASYITSSQVYGPYGASSLITSSYAISSSYSEDVYNSVSSSIRHQLIAYPILGYSMILDPMTPINAGVGIAAVSSTMFLIPSYLSTDIVTKGAKFWLNVAIATTATFSGYNGITLYSQSGANLLLVASSSNTGSLYTGTNGVWKSASFTVPYSASPGVYYMGISYSCSASPSLGYTRSVSSRTDYTNTKGYILSVGNQATPPSSVAISTTTNTTNSPYIFLF